MQRLTIVRYTVSPETVAENEALSGAVFDRLRQDRPEGIMYSVFKEADGVSFVHVFLNRIEDDSESFTSMSEFEAFSTSLPGRVTGPIDPVRISVTPVDSYGI